MLDIKNILTLIFGTVLGAVLNYLLGRWSKTKDKETLEEEEAIKDAKVEVKEQRKIVAELQSQMAVLKAEAVPIQAAFQAMLVAGLRHFHTPETDVLLDKSLVSILSTEEFNDLDVAMERRKTQVDSLIDEEERIKAALLMNTIRLNQIEAEKQEKAKTETVLVTQPATEGHPPEEDENS